MNWIKKTLKIGEKIKKLLKTRPTKQDIENSDWTSCCKGPVLKKDLEDNLWTCQLCGKETEDLEHFLIKCEKLKRGRKGRLQYYEMSDKY